MMNSKEYEQKSLKLKEQEESWAKEKELIIRKQMLEKDKDSIKSKKNKVSTTKLIVVFILINCTIVELYSMWVMYVLSDLSALYTLITAVIGESITFAIYAIKSTKENTSGGIVYEHMKLSQISSDINDNKNSAGDGVG